MIRQARGAALLVTILALAARAEAQDRPGIRDCAAAAERMKAACLDRGGTDEVCQALADAFLARCEGLEPERHPPIVGRSALGRKALDARTQGE